jgi:putative intracellular protease/amidase
MQIAFLLYEGFTPLDAVGPYQVLKAAPATVQAVLAGLAVAPTGCPRARCHRRSA